MFGVAFVVLVPASVERKRAIATRCAGVSVDPCCFIAPLSSAVMMAVCERFAIASGMGARFSGDGLWHARQFLSKSALPSALLEFWAPAIPQAKSEIRARL